MDLSGPAGAVGVEGRLPPVILSKGSSFMR